MTALLDILKSPLRTKTSNLFKALKSGRLRVTRPPGLIRRVKLEDYLKRCPNLQKLAKEIVFCYLYPNVYTRGPLYQLATRANYYADNTWVRLTVLSCSVEPTQLEDLLIVDFSVLEDPVKKEFLFNQWPAFRSELEMELSYVQRR